MPMTDGIDSQVDWSETDGVLAKLALLRDALPDPDTSSTSGSQQGIISYLDEMAPIAAAILRVEIDALIADLAGTDVAANQKDVAFGQYTAVAADATANQTDIVTGLADLVLANSAVNIFRAGTRVTADAVISEPTPGTLRVADGATTYVLTAGDIITWFARSA